MAIKVFDVFSSREELDAERDKHPEYNGLSIGFCKDLDFYLVYQEGDKPNGKA